MDGKIEGKIMITLIWIVWVSSLYIMVIMMLNFLIAIISQSYENVMSQQIVFQYQQKVEMNEECLMILNYFKFLENFTILAIVSEVTDSGN